MAPHYFWRWDFWKFFPSCSYMVQTPKVYFSWIKGASGCSSSRPVVQEGICSWPRSFVDIFVTEFKNENESNLQKRGFENDSENPY